MGTTCTLHFVCTSSRILVLYEAAGGWFDVGWGLQWPAVPVAWRGVLGKEPICRPLDL